MKKRNADDRYRAIVERFTEDLLEYNGIDKTDKRFQQQIDKIIEDEVIDPLDKGHRVSLHFDDQRH